MLYDYKSKYNKLPGIWLRHIDDIFSLGIMTKPSLEHFINFCKKTILQIKVQNLILP